MRIKPTEIFDRTRDTIWRSPPQDASGPKARVQRIARTLLVLARDVAEGQLTLRAMSLVYTTLLSIVPLLALSFSVLKAFGVYNQVEPMLLNVLAPLGEKGDEIAQRIMQFIGNMNVGVLGSVGLALLLYTAVSLVQKVEQSFNFIWHVKHARSFGERFSRYLSLLLVGPILVFSAMGVTATVTNLDLVRSLLAVEVLGQVAYVASRLVPYLLVIGAFTFAYAFIPNTGVRLASALVGGIVGGVLWQTAGWIFAEFVAASTRYTAIYASFAVLILFMIWIYVSWLILLFGASVAFYYQHPEYLLASGGEPQLSDRMRERLALAVMTLIAREHLSGRPAISGARLGRTLGMPIQLIEDVLDSLKHGGLVARNDGDPPGYLPARDASTIPVRHVLETVRAAGEQSNLTPSAFAVPPQVESVLRTLEQASRTALDAISLKDLAEESRSDSEAAEVGAVLRKIPG